MVHSQEDCSLDGSRLVFLSGSYGREGLDLSVNYCPRCDVAFVYLTPAGTMAPPAVFQWHRSGDQLELRGEDRPRWHELPRQFRECWESNVRHHIAGFLRGRYSERVACPMDGCPAEVLHRWRDEPRTDWLLAWCRWCKMGFLFASDRDYGWEHCANVVWAARHHQYELGKQYATGGGHRVSPQMVAELPPLKSVLADG
jgi:hypothetical protein